MGIITTILTYPAASAGGVGIWSCQSPKMHQDRRRLNGPNDSRNNDNDNNDNDNDNNNNNNSSNI